VDQSKIACCPKCRKIIVSWNWIGPLEQWDGNASWTEYMHECWICDSTFSTNFEVTNGVPYRACKLLWSLYEADQPLKYTKAMDLLYKNSK
jgi:hypothetical protein